MGGRHTSLHPGRGDGAAHGERLGARPRLRRYQRKGRAALGRGIAAEARVALVGDSIRVEIARSLCTLCGVVQNTQKERKKERGGGQVKPVSHSSLGRRNK